MEMKILVTGGAGFIGSHIVDAYIKLGHEVIVFDDLSTGKLENIDAGRCTFIKGDVSRRDHVVGLMERYGPFDVINHQAAQMSVSDSMKDPYNDIRINIIGTVNVLDILARSCKKFIFASSGGTVYGEQISARVERDPLEPVSPYGISKLACEKYVRMYSDMSQFEYAILRYSNVYGPRQNPHGEAGVIAIFAEKILKGELCTINGDGEYYRDYIHVRDVVEANIAALQEGAQGIHNISTGKTLTTNHIWDYLASGLRDHNPVSQNGPHRDGDIRFSCCVPGMFPMWEATVPFNVGIEDTLEWYKSRK